MGRIWDRSLIRVILIVGVVTATLIVSVGAAHASPVTYRYSGSCFSGSSPGNCSFFNLSDGDLVSGSITLDDARLSTTQFASFLPADPDLQFSFTFGSLAVGKNNLDPLDVLRVMLSDSSGLGIIFQNEVTACVNALFPCHVRQDGTEVLTVGTSFGFAQRYVGSTEVQTAYTNGAWTKIASPSPVPEPSTAVLLALGLAGLSYRASAKTGGCQPVAVTLPS
jgi:hypothetical protein